MKSGTESKLKFMGLKRQLKLPFWQIVGILESLWHTTLRNAPAGDIGKLSNEDIAAAIEWDGSADELIEALVATRWLDADPVFRLIVHDWSEHCPNYLKGGFHKGGKVFADVAAKLPAIATQLSSQKHAKNGSLATSSEGVATNPILTNPNQSNMQEAAKLPKQSQPSEVKRFMPPTLAEATAYCIERRNQVDPSRFIDHYETVGWMVGKSKMRNWKAAIRTWEKNNFQSNTPAKQPERKPEPPLPPPKPFDIRNVGTEAPRWKRPYDDPMFDKYPEHRLKEYPNGRPADQPPKNKS